MLAKNIEIIGANENNLKSLDVDIPLYESTVVVGISGSGKSSLIYDTLYNESQRIFLENLPFNSSKKSIKIPAKVDSINNLPAALSVSQHSYNQNPRSTIGTFTQISDYIRAIFSFLTRYTHQIILKPNDFSFNNPLSHCDLCKGTGEFYVININKVIPNKNKTLDENAIQWFQGAEKSLEFQTLKTYCTLNKIPMSVPFNQLSEHQKNLLLYDKSNTELTIKYKTVKGRYKSATIEFQGAIAHLESLLESIETPSIYRKVQKYLQSSKCPRCNGMRLNDIFLGYTVNKLNISQVELLNMKELVIWLIEVEELYNDKGLDPIIEIIQKVKGKIQKIQSLKLQYLTLTRTIPTLSGGELQRLRIANQLDTPLIGLLYIFDEPCKGLHVKDIDQIILATNNLLKRGNTVISIEHNTQFISAMQNTIYLGPGAGKHGGTLISKKQYLDSLPIQIHTPVYIKPENFIKLNGVNYNNLQNVDLKVPSRGITAFTGVSGSGKSSMMTVLERSAFNKAPTHCSIVQGVENLNRVYRLNQKPIHSNSRSTIVSYLEIFSTIRELFANTKKAKICGYNSSFFSPNVQNGRCEECKGQGEIKIEMTFFEDLYIPCEECNGTGFKPEILEIKYQNYNIYEFLNEDISEIVHLFEPHTKISNILNTLIELGMSYIKLGQPSSTLSGGEAQRIKLAKILGSSVKGNNLYLLDEPTSGLNTADMPALLNALNELSKDNCVVIIEHNIEFIKSCANYLIDFKTSPNSNDGFINACGLTPDIYGYSDLSFY